MSKYRILFKLSGSIAGFKSLALISKLIQDGHEVKTACTPATFQFIGSSSLEGLTGHPPFVDLFSSGHTMDHIHLAEWADLTILSPATANTINRLAQGLADDAVTTLFLAHPKDKPYLMAPAMNSHMYNHPSVQKSLKQLRSWGVRVLDTDRGSLACGHKGPGRLLNVDSIYFEIYKALHKKQNSKKKILLTYGGTEEPIDRVRCITNLSSGKTGAALSDYFALQGHDVTVLRSVRSQNPTYPVEELFFKSYDDLYWRLKTLLEKNYFHSVIHASAVSDYTVHSINAKNEAIASGNTKLSSSLEEVHLVLKPTGKIVNEIKGWSINKDLALVSFKLTDTQNMNDIHKIIEKSFHASQSDFIVHNDLNNINPEKDVHRFHIFKSPSDSEYCENYLKLAENLERRILFQNNSIIYPETSPKDVKEISP